MHARASQFELADDTRKHRQLRAVERMQPSGRCAISNCSQLAQQNARFSLFPSYGNETRGYRVISPAMHSYSCPMRSVTTSPDCATLSWRGAKGHGETCACVYAYARVRERPLSRDSPKPGDGGVSEMTRSRDRDTIAQPSSENQPTELTTDRSTDRPERTRERWLRLWTPRRREWGAPVLAPSRSPLSMTLALPPPLIAPANTHT